MFSLIRKHNIVLYFLLINLIIFAMVSLVQAETELVSEEKERNPFLDFRYQENEGSLTDEAISEAKTTAENNNEQAELVLNSFNPSFLLKGIVTSDQDKIAVIENEGRLEFLQLNQKLNGYQLIEIKANQIVMKKDNYLVNFEMGLDNNER